MIAVILRPTNEIYDSGYNDNYQVFRNMVFQITLNQVKYFCGFWYDVGMVNITINIASCMDTKIRAEIWFE